MSSNILIENLLTEIRQCRLCEPELPFGARPVLQASSTARILIVGQAPGRLVHETGLPFNDPSGDRLRDWLGVDREVFYDASRIAIIPMAFCFPGTGKSGDLPPPPICARTWRKRLMNSLPDVELTVVLGQYSIGWHLPEAKKQTLTKVVGNWRNYWPNLLPLPHPSPRNNLWLRRNPWVEEQLVPQLRQRVKQLL
ncbi:MAG: uracil-DNA glycosylase family protein [Porticoccaceae bacterium]